MKRYLIHRITVTDDHMTTSRKGFTKLAEFHGSESFRWVRDHCVGEVTTEKAYNDYGYEHIWVVHALMAETDYIYWKLKYT